MNFIKINACLFFLLVACGCMQCRQQGPEKNAAVPGKIDLFREPGKVSDDATKNAVMQPDTAFKYSAVSGQATALKIADSSLKSEFYLYSMNVSDVEKGMMRINKGKIYFIAYHKLLPVHDSAKYTFYLVPVVNHNLLKYNRHIQWQWYSNAPFLESL